MKKIYRVHDFVKQYGSSLDLQLVCGSKGFSRRILVPEPQRPGLPLTGYYKGYTEKRMQIFGRSEIHYLRDLDPSLVEERLRATLASKTPAVIIGRNLRPPLSLVKVCQEAHIPLFRSKMMTMDVISRLTFLLTEEFAPCITISGTFVAVFGVGVLIQGDSAVGKSEAALGLIERGHYLISDDVVRVRRRTGRHLEGSGLELSAHHMEIRGIGIVNVAHLYGAVCVREKKRLNIVVKLEVWDDNTFYDRVGLTDETREILGVGVPFHLLPVKPGRDVVLLLETIALNYRLKQKGFHSAKEFKKKLLDTLSPSGGNGRRDRC